MTRSNHARWRLALVAAFICAGCGKSDQASRDIPLHGERAKREAKGKEDLDLEGQVPISTFDELQAMQNDLAGDYVLVNDIDCSGFDFEPVGSEESPFTGTLDGQGFVIAGLSIDRPSDDLVGLFRVANSATIRNVQLWQPVVTGERRVGALSGRVIGSTVRNVHVHEATAGLPFPLTSRTSSGQSETDARPLTVAA